MNREFYYKTDMYHVGAILENGLAYDFFKTDMVFGFALYLSPDINKTVAINKNIPMKIVMETMSNILVVKNRQELVDSHLAQHNPNVTTYLNRNGWSSRIGVKYVVPFAKANNIKGIWVTEEKLLVLYNSDDIKNIELV
jgi:hypothetical protein